MASVPLNPYNLCTIKALYLRDWMTYFVVFDTCGNKTNLCVLSILLLAPSSIAFLTERLPERNKNRCTMLT